MAKSRSTEEKARSFFEQYRERTYPKGQIIVFAGEENDNAYYLSNGTVKKYTVNYKGDEILLNIFRPGTFWPVAQAIGQKRINRFYYAADTDVVVRVAPTKDVVDMLMKNPDIMMGLLQRVNLGLDEFLGRAVSLMASNALSRVVYEIFVEASRITDGKNGEFWISLSERGIAARTGLTRETVNREIRKLKDLKAVRVERGGLVIMDLALLEKKLYKELL